MVYQIKSLKELQEKLVNTYQLVVINFHATWSEGSNVVTSEIEELANQFTNAVFYNVDIEEGKTIAAEYNVDKVPTVIFFKDGEQVDVLDDATIDKLKTALEIHH